MPEEASVKINLPVAYVLTTCDAEMLIFEEFSD
jgi:hypothetical protein